MNIRLLTVSSNIRLRPFVLSLILGLFSAMLIAQEPAQTAPKEQTKIAQKEQNNETKQGLNEDVETPSTSTLLRLEDTIRGNKEQPQVLTIVPWQLPVHQRINENTQWQTQVTRLPAIERGAFLRNLSVVNDIKEVQQANKAVSSTIEDE